MNDLDLNALCIIDSNKTFDQILLSTYLDSKRIPILEYLINLDSYQGS